MHRSFHPAAAGRALILRNLLGYNDVHFMPRQRAREVVDSTLVQVLSESGQAKSPSHISDSGMGFFAICLSLLPREDALLRF